MNISALTVAIAIVLSSSSPAIQQKEIDYQSKNFKRWWDAELEWQFDELPTQGGVPRFRIPYSGYIYLDAAGGTTHALHKYDLAFHSGQSLAASYEQRDVTAQQELTHERRGLFGLRRVGVYRTPSWHGHCNGWTAATIRHAEPQTSVTRNHVVFSPADIKALLADTYMYNDHEFLGGIDDAINPGTLHVIIANWIGRGNHPVGMEATVGPEKWNYPVYAFSTSSAKRSDREVEVKMNIAFSDSTRQEYQHSPHLKRIKYFHYRLTLDEEGKIVGGGYFSDSSQIDMLWTPLRPTRTDEDEDDNNNNRSNPHVDVQEVLAIWRESVPKELRAKWFNIDPTEEDRIFDAGETLDSRVEADSEGVDAESELASVDDGPVADAGTAADLNPETTTVSPEAPARPAPAPLFRRLFGGRPRRR
ncbi:MAG: hypothetical protein ACC628_23740 [Pirellulaceae bacterium]